MDLSVLKSWKENEFTWDTIIIDKVSKQQVWNRTYVPLEYGVKFDKSISVTVKKKVKVGKQVQIVDSIIKAQYGETTRPVMVWKLHPFKGGSIYTTAQSSDNFLRDNLIAFYWIHKTRLESKGVINSHIKQIMFAFSAALFKYCKYTHETMWKSTWEDKWDDPKFKGKIETQINKAWDWIRDNGNSTLKYYGQLTTIHPKNKVSRRVLNIAVKRERALNDVDDVREDMDINERWMSEAIRDEFKIVIGYGLSKGMMNLYWDKLGVNLLDRNMCRIAEWLISNPEIRDNRMLADRMGISERTVISYFSKAGMRLTKGRRNAMGLLKLILKPGMTKKMLIEKSGLSKTAVYKYVKQDRELSKLWQEL